LSRSLGIVLPPLVCLRRKTCRAAGSSSTVDDCAFWRGPPDAFLNPSIARKCTFFQLHPHVTSTNWLQLHVSVQCILQYFNNTDFKITTATVRWLLTKPYGIRLVYQDATVGGYWYSDAKSYS
jgi:hypothetical protein